MQTTRQRGTVYLVVKYCNDDYRLAGKGQTEITKNLQLTGKGQVRGTDRTNFTSGPGSSGLESKGTKRH